MSAICPQHGVPSTGTCERCGTFFCEQCRVERICVACSQRPAPPRRRTLAIASLSLFAGGLAVSCIPLFGMLIIVAFPLGFALGIASLLRERSEWPLALIGVLLNGAVIAAALFIGFASGWRA
jgi:hypothetical protein